MLTIERIRFCPGQLRHLWILAKGLCCALPLLIAPVARSLAQSPPPPPQGTQTDAAFADSFKLNHVTNVFATTHRISCYTPEVPFFVNLRPTNGYPGAPPCN